MPTLFSFRWAQGYSDLLCLFADSDMVMNLMGNFLLLINVIRVCWHEKLRFAPKSAFLYLKSAVLLTCKFCLYTLYYTLENGFSKSLGQSSLPKWPQKIFELQCFCNDDLAFFKKILGLFILSSTGWCWHDKKVSTYTKVQQIL